MRIPGLLFFSGVCFGAPSLLAQEHPKPVEKAKPPAKPAQVAYFCMEFGLERDCSHAAV